MHLIQLASKKVAVSQEAYKDATYSRKPAGT